MVAEKAPLELPGNLPQLPEGWRYQPLGSLVYDKGICYGIVQPGSDTPQGIPIVRVNNIRNSRIETKDVLQVRPDIEEKYIRSRLVGGEVLLTLVGTLGEVAIAPKELKGWNVARAVGVIPVLEDPGSRWVSICLRSRLIQHFIQMWATTTVQATFNLRDVARLPIPLPPKHIREAIAHILGTLDDKIELNRRMNETLESMARAIFKSWFVDFDPVRAKMDGRKPTGMDDATAALFPSSFEDSELGMIPRGWSAGRLADRISFQGGFAFKSKDWQDEGVPVVKIGSVKPGIIDLNQVSYVSKEIADQASRYRLDVGDLLIGMTGYVGEVGIVPPTRMLPLLNQRVGKFLLPTNGTGSLGFWYCTTRQAEFRSFVEGRSHGTAQANVSATGIMEYPLVVPSDNVMEVFNLFCRPAFERILSNHDHMRVLATNRDTLLPKLLSGEIRVSEAEQTVAEVA